MCSKKSSPLQIPLLNLATEQCLKTMHKLKQSIFLSPNNHTSYQVTEDENAIIITIILLLTQLERLGLYNV